MCACVIVLVEAQEGRGAGGGRLEADSAQGGERISLYHFAGVAPPVTELTLTCVVMLCTAQPLYPL